MHPGRSARATRGGDGQNALCYVLGLTILYWVLLLR